MSFSHKYPDGSCSHQAVMTFMETGEAKCADCGEVLRPARPQTLVEAQSELARSARVVWNTIEREVLVPLLVRINRALRRVGRRVNR